MNNLRRLCAGFILTLALAAPAFAGQMDCPGITQQPPPTEVTVAGEMPNGVESTGTVTETVFSLIVTVLSLS